MLLPVVQTITHETQKIFWVRTNLLQLRTAGEDQIGVRVPLLRRQRIPCAVGALHNDGEVIVIENAMWSGLD